MYMYIDTQTQIFLLLLYPMSGSKGLGIAWVLKARFCLKMYGQVISQ